SRAFRGILPRHVRRPGVLHEARVGRPGVRLVTLLGAVPATRGQSLGAHGSYRGGECCAGAAAGVAQHVPARAGSHGAGGMADAAAADASRPLGILASSDIVMNAGVEMPDVSVVMPFLDAGPF